MPANFFTLPRELRDKIYELCLLIKKTIYPFGISHRRLGISPALLRVNKAIADEARLILYRNCFDFTTSSEGISLFLEKIGPNNANCIRHVYIDFPIFRNLELSNVTIEENNIRTLVSIQSSCSNLKSLTMFAWSTEETEYDLDSLDNPKIAAEALALAYTRLRAISSLQHIIVEVYKNAPSDYIRKEVETQGWTIREVENPQEREEFFDDGGDPIWL